MAKTALWAVKALARAFKLKWPKRPFGPEFEITSLQLHFFLTLKWSGRFFGNSLYFTSLWKFEKKFHFTSLRFLKKWFFFTSLYFTSNFVSSEVTSLHFNFQKSDFFSLYLTSLRIFDGEKLLHFTLKWCFQVYFLSLFLPQSL